MMGGVAGVFILLVCLITPAGAAYRHKTLRMARWLDRECAYHVDLWEREMILDTFAAASKKGMRLEVTAIADRYEENARKWCEHHCKGGWKVFNYELFLRRKSDVAAFILYREQIYELPDED